MYLESTPLSVEEVMAVWVQQEPIPPPLTNKDTQSGGIVYSEEAEAEPLPQQWVAQVVPQVCTPMRGMVWSSHTELILMMLYSTQGGTDLYTLYGAVGKLIITRERADRYSLNLIIRIGMAFRALYTTSLVIARHCHLSYITCVLCCVRRWCLHGPIDGPNVVARRE